MKSYELSEEAQLDLFDAFDFIADRNLNAAIAWHKAMLDTFEHLAAWPRTGRLRDDIAPASIRFWIVGEYVILYEPESDPVRIISIFHGARDVQHILAVKYNQPISENEGDSDD
jgi:toxin ParE1/3/4